jgi:hypothetical protein
VWFSSLPREAAGAQTPGFPCALFEKGQGLQGKTQVPRAAGMLAPALRKGLFPCWQEAVRAVVSPAKFPFGNRVLTLISVWLEA